MQFPCGVPLSSLIPFLLQLPTPPVVYLMCTEAHLSPELRQQGILIGLSVPKLLGLQFSPSSASRVLILTQDHPPSWLYSPVLLTTTCSVFTEILALDHCAFAPAHIPRPVSGLCFSLDFLCRNVRRYVPSQASPRCERTCMGSSPSIKSLLKCF